MSLLQREGREFDSHIGYMKVDKRKFNKSAYDECDRNPKELLIKIMNNLGYQLHGNLEDENYKKFDLVFHNEKTHKFVSFENEVRKEFITIRDVYPTIHIPIRKFNSQLDFYLVWKPDLTQVISIDRETFLQYREHIVSVECKTEIVDGENVEYAEDFIDVDKELCKLYFVNHEYKLIDFPNPEIIGFLNYP